MIALGHEASKTSNVSAARIAVGERIDTTGGWALVVSVKRRAGMVTIDVQNPSGFGIVRLVFASNEPGEWV